ncbi:MAG: hypothetical protein IT198_16830 [Acidimicrobiia bacterium]|nr:hypothetical protein [Acidimicrobiia bacterium]
MSPQTPGPVIGETTEEIPVVPERNAPSSAPTDVELFGAAGSLRGLRFNGRTLMRALVLAVWALALGVFGLAFYGTFARVAPTIPRWWVVLGAVALGVAVVVILSDVDEPDVEDGTAGHEFHELDWSRKELYSVRALDVAWALVELSPLLALVLTVWR